MSQFEKKLKELFGDHSKKEIEELILDQFFKEENHLSKGQMEDLEKYKNLIHLSMNGIGIKNLKNFPNLQKLKIVKK